MILKFLSKNKQPTKTVVCFFIFIVYVLLFEFPNKIDIFLLYFLTNLVTLSTLAVLLNISTGTTVFT